MVTKYDRWIYSYSSPKSLYFCQLLIIKQATMPTMTKATADENPTHSGIFFYPIGLPFLLMS